MVKLKLKQQLRNPTLPCQVGLINSQILGKENVETGYKFAARLIYHKYDFSIECYIYRSL